MTLEEQIEAILKAEGEAMRPENGDGSPYLISVESLAKAMRDRDLKFCRFVKSSHVPLIDTDF